MGGPNGAGKTTFFTMFGSTVTIEFVNADIVAQALNHESPETAAITAGRKVLKRLSQLKEEKNDFAFEATFAGVWHAKYLQELKDAGFKVVIFFVWLRSQELAVERVNEKARVRHGGHDVPEQDIRRRYLRSSITWRIYIVI